MFLPRESSFSIGNRIALGYFGSSESGLPTLADFVDLEWSEEVRDSVAAHLDNGVILIERNGSSLCRICGRKGGDRCFGDHAYNWPERLSHYVREHGVRPPQRFVDHVQRRRATPWFAQVEDLCSELRKVPDNYAAWAVLGDLLTEHDDPRSHLIHLACRLAESPLPTEECHLRSAVREYCEMRPLVWFEELGLPPSIQHLAGAVRFRNSRSWEIEVPSHDGLMLQWQVLAEGRTGEDLLSIAGSGFQSARWQTWRLGPPVTGSQLVGLVMLASQTIARGPAIAESAGQMLDELFCEVLRDHRHIFGTLPRALLWSWIDAASGVKWGTDLGSNLDGLFKHRVRSLWNACEASLDRSPIRHRLWQLVLHDRHAALRNSPGFDPSDVDTLFHIARALGTPDAEGIPLAWSVLQWDAAHSEGPEELRNAAAQMAHALAVAEATDIDTLKVLDDCRNHAKNPLPSLFYHD